MEERNHKFMFNTSPLREKKKFHNKNVKIVLRERK